MEWILAGENGPTLPWSRILDEIPSPTQSNQLMISIRVEGVDAPR